MVVPEHMYRDFSIPKLVSQVVSIKSWQRITKYWLFREGVAENIGSEDAYLYVKEGHPDINFITEKIRHGH